MESPLTKFKDAMVAIGQKNPQAEIALVMHDNPDPDCVGAAFGLQKLIKSWLPEAKCSFIHGGEISHPQNKTMVNVLNLQLVNRDGQNISNSTHQAFVSIDCLPDRCGLSGVEFLMSIDHHKGDTKKSKIKDVRMVGSCSSIIVEYLQKEGVKFDKDNDDDQDVATALVMGIKTDTSDLSSDSTTDLDFDAYKYLIGYVNQNKLASIIRYPFPPYYFELRSKLDQEGNSYSENGIFIGGIGYIQPSKRDVLPTIAEERSRVEGINTAFIFAIVGSNIEISVRSNGLSVDVNSICQNIFGKEYAGGKMGAGAGKCPMGHLSIEDDPVELQEKMWIAIREKVIYSISKEMSNHR